MVKSMPMSEMQILMNIKIRCKPANQDIFLFIVRKGANIIYRNLFFHCYTKVGNYLFQQW